MKKTIFAIALVAISLFVSCAPVGPKPLTGSKLQQIQDSFAFSDENGEEGIVEGAVSLSIDGVSLTGVSELVIYYGTDAENDKELVGETATSGFTSGTVATLEASEFTGEERLFLFLKNSAVTTGNNEVFSGVELSVVDTVEEEVVEEAVEEDELEEEIALEHILFGFNLSFLTDEAKAILDEFVISQQDIYSVEVVIEGHADERGSNEYNLALGERRASAVKDYLVLQGIPSENIEILSYGEERPLCEESDEDCWQENRRAETRYFLAE